MKDIYLSTQTTLIITLGVGVFFIALGYINLKKISDNKNATRSTKVVFGRINNQTILYTSAEVNSGEISIISSSDYGHSYQVIGGRGFSAFKPYNNGFTAFARGGSENKSHHKDLGVNNIAVVLENTLGHNLNYNSC